MDFTVHGTDRHESFTGESTYHFDDTGMLRIHTGDGRQRIYSPSGWSYIEHQATVTGVPSVF